MKLDIYQIDAFANKPFEGNPAAVCPLQSWLPDELMQSIAEENNLSETVFFVKEGSVYRIRWFTPTTEVDLCGHATLAAAYVLFDILGIEKSSIKFSSKSGPLTVVKRADQLVLDFPAQEPVPCVNPESIEDCLGVIPASCLQTDDLIAVFEKESDVRNLQPNFEQLKQLDYRGVIVTAAALDYDFIARFFAPRSGINEDPVTGSAYTKLIPYWSARLGKKRLQARQVSNRGGDVSCEMLGERVLIAGHAAAFMQGTIELNV